MDWLVTKWNWPAASLFSACVLLALLPVWYARAGLLLTLVYLQLPLYMLHQWEEHRGDRFRLYINRTIGKGLEVLTPTATFWINLLGVWAIDLLALYLACFVNPSLGLIAIYLPLINSLGHIMPGLARREYNPGLGTSLLLFVPISGWSLMEVSRLSQATVASHAIGIGVALAVHGAIVAHVVHRMRRLKNV
jgi:hypothetical protein